MTDYRIYVTQREDRHVIKRLDSNVSPATYDGSRYGIFSEIGQLNFPSGVTTDGTDIYLADYDNRRIVWLDNNLELIGDHVMESAIVKPRLIYYDADTTDFYVLSIIPNMWNMTLVRLHKESGDFSEEKTSGLLGKMDNCSMPMGMTKDNSDLIVCGLGTDLFIAVETGNSFMPFVNQTISGILPTRYVGIIKHSNGYFYLNDGTKIIQVSSNFTSVGDSNYISKTVYGLKEARDGTILLYNADAKSILRYDENLNFVEEIFKDQGYSTRDNNTWIARDSNREWYDVAMSNDGKIQTAIVYNGQIYTSTDYGVTWTARDSNRQWWGVAVSDSGGVQTATAYDGQIYTSTNYGVTWVARDSNRWWSKVAMSSNGKIQTALEFGGRVYTSTDYGATWTMRDVVDRLWQDVAMSNDGRIQTAVTGLNSIFIIPGYIYVSYDYGVTWTQKGSLQCWNSVAMSDDGRVQTAIVTFPFPDSMVYTSNDYGNTWTLILNDHTPKWSATMSDSGKLQIISAIDRIYISTDYGATWSTRVKSGWIGMIEAAVSGDGVRQTLVAYTGPIYTLYVSSSIELDCINVFDFVELDIS